MSDLPPPPPPGEPVRASTVATPSSAPPPPPGPAVRVVPMDAPAIEVPPRAGELTLGWRVATAAAWVGVIVSFAAIWNASVQLGLSTWWLGPRGAPRPRLIQLSPFVVPVLMVLGTINNVRWLGRIGVVAGLLTAAVGVADLGRVPSIAVTELLIAAAAIAVSLASLSGTYRTRRV